ncbi:CocE/NonD family hydrolase C-terminal non-catalytic domain-containing protein [Promicromonospora sp. NPDC019610]|uniref:CocE/NonD family hydrolase C-terminal non-catalytic domain-containing protein n=1 Tax=Promicromonospora sp. NPDC019610 TaxID=3364405 RepID=UPI0037897DFB
MTGRWPWVTLRLSPTAHVLRAGHRIRVQVAGGAFPCFVRNLGGGEQLVTATTPPQAHIEISTARSTRRRSCYRQSSEDLSNESARVGSARTALHRQVRRHVR